MSDMLFPQESFIFRSQGRHGNPASEDYGWRASAGGRNQWFIASHDGVVTTLVDGRDYDPNGGLGNFYTLKMDNGSTIRCGHCQRDAFTVRKGDRVERGQRIGRMGNSGFCINGAYHTHMTFWDAYGNVVLPSESGMRVHRDAVIFEGQTDMFAYERNIENVGTPVERDKTRDQIRISTALNARSGPYLMENIKGLFNHGYYNVTEIVDKTDEPSNGHLWYKTHDWLYGAQVRGVTFYGKDDGASGMDAEQALREIYVISKKALGVE